MKGGSTILQDDCRMVICTNRCHTSPPAALFQGLAVSEERSNVDTNVHFCTTGGKFHNAGICTASALCPLFTDIRFAAAHGYGNRAYNPSPPQDLVQWRYVQGM